MSFSPPKFLFAKQKSFLIDLRSCICCIRNVFIAVFSLMLLYLHSICNSFEKNNINFKHLCFKILFEINIYTTMMEMFL